MIYLDAGSDYLQISFNIVGVKMKVSFISIDDENNKINESLEKVLKSNSTKKLLKFWTFFVKDKEEEQDNISADEARSQFDTAECCTPIPGDDVTGYKDPETGRIIVHKTNCHRLRKLAAQHGKNLVSNISWSSYKEVSYLTVIEIQGIDRMGMLLDLSQVITGQHNINIRELKMQSHDGIFEGKLSLYVQNADALYALMDKFRHIKGLERVKRIENNEME